MILERGSYFSGVIEMVKTVLCTVIKSSGFSKRPANPCSEPAGSASVPPESSQEGEPSVVSSGPYASYKPIKRGLLVDYML